MRLRFIWPGKTKDEHLRALVEEYLKRLTRFVRCEVIETREGAGDDPASVKKESQRILEAIPNGSVALLLDVKGLEWNSQELADEVRRWEHDAIKEVAVVIGGPDGVSAEVAASIPKRWRLTRLTLTHEMARVVAVEQLYRAYTINRGLPYQK
ncbi:MAG: rRNA (pseudouridine1915-N3)-methyltransferase [Blastocatellia bacterium]|jgi:23S rRNA (pseudouridine1915-N3)-methyltransferase|nr:rRNA (pseudouridine1915-N3)-methyltransferase [Blastocatellia bacterium]